MDGGLHPARARAGFHTLFGLSLLLAPCGSGALMNPEVATRGWGVNVHWGGSKEAGGVADLPTAAELAQLSAAFSLARLDMTWSTVERPTAPPGTYDFAAYDTLFALLLYHHVTPYVILDYGNPLYDGGQAPQSAAAVAALVRWATAAVSRYRGRGIVWEFWNEPNVGTGTPGKGYTNATAYTVALTAVGESLRAQGLAAETLVGPAAAGLAQLGFDLGWMRKVFEGGGLRYLSAISVHPYRPGPPESVLRNYASLKKLLNEFDGRQPIWSGEWGWSNCHAPCTPQFSNPARVQTESQQGIFLARSWLTNVLAGVDVSIWYEWQDGSGNLSDTESHFGVVYRNDTAHKQAYKAAAHVKAVLGSAEFEARVPLRSPHLYLLRFTAGRFALWSSADDTDVKLPLLGCFKRTNCWGIAMGNVCQGDTVRVIGEPSYMVPMSDVP